MQIQLSNRMAIYELLEFLQASYHEYALLELSILKYLISKDFELFIFRRKY